MLIQRMSGARQGFAFTRSTRGFGPDGRAWGAAPRRPDSDDSSAPAPAPTTPAPAPTTPAPAPAAPAAHNAPAARPGAAGPGRAPEREFRAGPGQWPES